MGIYIYFYLGKGSIEINLIYVVLNIILNYFLSDMALIGKRLSFTIAYVIII